MFTTGSKLLIGATTLSVAGAVVYANCTDGPEGFMGTIGLIFAAIGRQLGVVDERLFSVIVTMVILTTLATPPVLAWLLGRGAGREGGSG